MLKKFLFYIVLINFIFINNFVLSEIIPLKKPIQTKDETQKKLLIDVLRPLPKPIKKTEKKKIEEKITEKKKTVGGLILPKKKPLIAGSTPSKKVELKKSKYFNKKDFALAKKAISEMKKAKWPNALKTSKKAKDKSIYNFIQWRHLLKKGNQATFFDYKNFIDKNKDYPRIGRVKYLAEHKLSTNKVQPKKIIDYFENTEPLSGFGKMIQGESFVMTGEKEKGLD